LKGARNVAPALERIAEHLSAPGEALIPGRTGAQARQTGAVRLAGGNWAPGQGPKELVREFDEAQQATLPEDVSNLFNSKISKYIQQDLGTPTDPLRTKELTGPNTAKYIYKMQPDGTRKLMRKEQIAEPVDTSGQLHMTQKDLNRMNNQFGETSPRDKDYIEMDYAGNTRRGFGPKFKQSYSQGDESRDLFRKADKVVPEARTGWENLSDAHVNMMTPEDLKYYARGPLPKWANALPDDTQLARLSGDAMENLGFGNIRQYMKEATAPPRPADYVGPLSPEQKAIQDLKLNIQGNPEKGISPADRMKQMSISDLVDNTGQMANRAARERLLGDLRSTEARKVYENDQHYISELKPEGLKHETEALGNCVGDSCDYENAIRDGNSRIYSLRDKKTGEPGVTIEAQREVPEINDLPEAEQARLWHEAEVEAGRTDADPKEVYWSKYQKAMDEIQPKPVWNISQVRGVDQNAAVAPHYAESVIDFLNKGDPEGGAAKWAYVEPEEFTNHGLQNVGSYKGQFMHRPMAEDAAKKFGKLDMATAYGGGVYDWDNYLKSMMTDPVLIKKHDTPEKLQAAIYNDFSRMLKDDRNSAIKPILEDIPAGWEDQWKADYKAKLDAQKAAASADAQNTLPLIEEPGEPGGMFRGGRVGYAQGGSISAGNTVGLGTFGQGDQQVSSGGGGGMGNPFGGGYGLTAGTPPPAPASAAAPVVSTPNGPMTMRNGQNGWTFENGNLAQGDVGNAPTYDDVFSTFLGQTYFTPGKYDPALAMTLNAGNQGMLRQGLDAFIGHGTDDPNGTDPLSQAAAAGYRSDDLKNLARNFGLNADATDLETQLRDRTKDYYGIGGMSAGWNGSPDARIGNMTLYQRKDGKLVPIQTNSGHLPEQGSFIEEHPGVLAPLAVVGGGLAAAYFGAGAAGAGAGAAEGAGGAGAASGLGSYWSSMPAWAQGAAQGAASGALSSGVQGQNPIKGAAMGALTGGVGGAAGSALADAGAGSTLSSLGGKAASMGTGMAARSILSGDPQQQQARAPLYSQPAQSQIPTAAPAPAPANTGILNSKYFTQAG
jgi:hypothetical protein